MIPNKTRGEYRPIYEALFHAPEYLALSAPARLVLLTLKCNSGAIGLRSWPGLVAILEELCGLPTRDVKRALEELEAGGWIEREGHLVWIVNGLRFEPSISTGTKHQAYVAKQLAALPPCALVSRFRARYADYLPDTPSDTPSMAHRRGGDTLGDTTAPAPTTTPTTTPAPATAPSPPAAAMPRVGLLAGDSGGPSRAALLTAAVNRGLTARYGEQPMPIRHSHPSVADALEAFSAAGVPDEFAQRVLFDRAAQCTSDRPPRSLGYFRAAVLEAWEAEQAHRQAATFAVPTASGGSDGAQVVPLDAEARLLIRYARQGDADYQAECTRRGLAWEGAA